MNIDSRAHRLSSLLAATSLTLTSAGLVPSARAQDATDPPWRVGRLAQTTGSVSTHGSGATDWTTATLNVPLTSGDAVWTQPSSSASIQISDDLVALNGSTELDLATLDNAQFIATEPQGEVFLGLPDMPSGDSYTVTTPRGAVQIGGAGQYDIVAGDSATPTTISVISGSARIVSGSFSLEVSANQTATVTGSDSLQGSIGPLQRDEFLSDEMGRLAPPSSGGQAAPQAVRYMTGGDSLAQYGAWQPSPNYGQVWYPHVDSGWAPYREGSWSYVAPWGWTWVDNEPWGFAPFHYGRWSQFDGRWGWVPAEQQAPADYYQQPAYAPALVDFVVAGAVAGVVAGALAGGFGGGHGGGGGGGNIGWIPLGPNESYHPQFNASRTYISQVNYGHNNDRITNTSINNRTSNTIINNYANRNALTVVPASAMARSEQVGRVARVGPAAMAATAGHGAAPQFQQVRGAFPVRPVADTRGVTPAVVQRLGLAAGPARPAAPGPAVNPQLFRPHELPSSRTPFRGQATPVATATRPASATPGTAGAAAGVARPAAPGSALQPVRPNGLPALRTPGAAPAGITPRPETARPAASSSLVAGHPGQPATAARPEAARSEPARPQPGRAEESRPTVARPAPHPIQLHQAPARPQPARVAPPQPRVAEPTARAEPARPRAEPARPAAAARPEPHPAPAGHPAHDAQHRDEHHPPG